MSLALPVLDERYWNMASQSRILVVEPAMLSVLLGDHLVAKGYEVIKIHWTDILTELTHHGSAKLVLLDLMMLGLNAYTLCREIKKRSDIQIITLTSDIDEIDQLLELGMEVDDYIYKPTRPEEITMRVKIALRRSEATAIQTEIDRLQLDEINNNAFWGGKNLQLTPVEFRLLRLLARNSHLVYSRALIMNSIYQDKRLVSDNTIETHIKNLRQKLTAASSIKSPIETSYGRGYRLTLND